MTEETFKRFIKSELEKNGYKRCVMQQQYDGHHYCWFETEMDCGFQSQELELSEFSWMTKRKYRECEL